MSMFLNFNAILVGCFVMFCVGCNEGPRVSPVFARIDLQAVVRDPKRPEIMPELRTTRSLTPDYNFMDCEVIWTAPRSQASNATSKIVSYYTNQIVRFGGKILSNTNDIQWGSCTVTYETAQNKGQIVLYSSECGESHTKLVTTVFETRRH
jgi:hypothetical protein